MYDLGQSFHIDLEKLKSNPDAILTGAKYRFTVLTERLIRLEYSEKGTFNDLATQLVSNRAFPVPKFDRKEDANFLQISTDYFDLYYTKNAKLSGSTLNPSINLNIKLKGKGGTWYYGHPEAKNYYGNDVSTEVKKGEKPENRGLYSLDGFVSFDDSKSLRINSLGTIEEPIEGNYDVYVFMYNKDFGLCVQDYFQLTGMPSLIPRYALGNWWCRDLPYKDTDIETLVKNFESHNIPLSVLLLDKDWHIRNYGEYKDIDSNYKFNGELIKDPVSLVSMLHSQGIRVGLEVNPKDGIYPFDERYEQIKQFLGSNESGIIKLDPLNPKMLDVVLKLELEPLEKLGIDFFWNNYRDSNLKRLWVYNNYIFRDLARNNEKRGMILARNALYTPHKYPVLYSGKSTVGWENFMSMPFFTLSASNIGACWWSHDVGGFDQGIEDPELYIRSVEFGVFCPILRFHAASGKYYKREPWKWDSKTRDIVTHYLELRHRLTPYLYTEAYKYHKTGSMIFQPLYYYVPAVYDDKVYRCEYFFGSELLVSPIVEPKNTIMNRTIHRFTLPEGMWYEFTTGKKYIGNTKYVSFYKEEDYPVFAKKGSIIPLSIKSNINNTTNPTDLEIHVFPGQNNTYRMYEDDGISNMFTGGYFLITEIDYNYMPNNYTLIIRSVEGKSGIAPDRRNYKIRFRNTKYAEEVVAYFDSTKIEITDKYIENNDFIVIVNDVSTIGQLTINCKGKDIEIDAVRVINEDLDEILSDLQIQTTLKEKIADILFSDKELKTKRLEITRLKKQNLDKSFVNLFLKLLDYIDKL